LERATRGLDRGRRAEGLRVVVADERRVREGDARAQVLGVGQARRECRELDVLAGLGVDPLDLAEAEAQQLGLARSLARLGEQRVGLHAAPAALGSALALLAEPRKV